ncbi:se14 [Alphabaculovirus alterspexiguae]|uniref:Se14 n=1 Tax=Spodoptera exigua multiple nucleopolyhedrovirus TaxID=10454 RepID=A0A3G2JTV7_9ABAC|nr:se14 [Spodoptera exigua multiple nucleopolyhedrovirus]AYN44974.1 se14 [Spodoptera exigua multiple nucleopolyhedrovirus]
MTFDNLTLTFDNLTLQNTLDDETTTDTIQNKNNLNYEEDLNKIFSLIIRELAKNENNDFGMTTKIILGILVFMAFFTLKTKIYRLSTCLRRKKQRKINTEEDNSSEALEKITIKEINYNHNEFNTIV